MFRDIAQLWASFGCTTSSRVSFLDIDEPISSHGGAVHAYVGDEVIVCWPVTADPTAAAFCVSLRLNVAWRASQQTIVASLTCSGFPGWAARRYCQRMWRRQTLARLFGDTMHVAARLCERCKAADQRLVVSGFAT
jgi:adenylate cyclase